MLSRFFIDRPIFASVIAVLMVIAGGVSLLTLPIAQFPEITPPMIQVTASYPGADPQVVADTVASPIEEQVNGVEGMLYMKSSSASDGSYGLQVTFELGTNVDMASVMVQNRVDQALPSLPEEVQRLGVSTEKTSTNMVAVVSVYSPQGEYDDLFLANYVNINIKDTLSRVNGVGTVNVYPIKDYSMRIWLDPNRMDTLGITADDVVLAVRGQNVQVAAGRIGEPPAPKGQVYELSVNTLGRLKTIDQFERIILKAAPDGRVTRLKDIARIELGGQDYSTFSLLNGQPAATMVVFQRPGANALDVADGVRKELERLSGAFPKGVAYKIVHDNTEFVRASISEVVKTLLIAFLLVSGVVFIFLQEWRATLIPAITIPVSLIGAFSLMALFGFSLNMTTLFGLVLAIGIVVDDAIVVVENVSRNMEQFGLSARDAAVKAMREVTGPIVSTTLVLMAVFVPPAFLAGITGQLYRQFSLTIAVTTLFSAINALTLSPALCGLLLRPQSAGKRFVLFRWFNAIFDRFTRGYSAMVSVTVRRVGVMIALFLVLLGLTYVGLVHVPTGFIPSEDDGLIVVNVQLPDAASLQRTEKVIQKIIGFVKDMGGVQNAVALGGYSSIAGTAANMGTVFIPLKPWDQRLPQGLSKDVIMARIARKLAGVQQAVAFPYSFPPIPGLGQVGGFEMQVQDRSNRGLESLEAAANEVVRHARSQSGLANVNSTFRAAVPQLYVDIDRTKVFELNVPLQSVFETMEAFLGSTYINDFNKFGRTWHVNAQAQARHRAKPSDIKRLKVRNKDGHMVPLGTFVKIENSFGPQKIDRFNLYPSALVTGDAAAGTSSGQALEIMDQLAAASLPSGMGFDWSGMSFQEKKAGGKSVYIFLLAITVAILVLAAQYESWTDPFAVVLIVPLAVLGAMAALSLRHVDNNLYTQVGLVLLVGLAAKNGILIVEFARDKRAEGMTPREAAVEAAQLRIRPILMTSFAFIMGVLPLVIATGAGAVSRQALGTAVFGGMLGVTLLGINFTPALYVLMQGRKASSQAQHKTSTPAPETIDRA